MAFLDETGLAEFKEMTDKAYLEKTFTPTNTFKGNYSGTSLGETFYYEDVFPDQNCIPIIADEDFWNIPIGSSCWIRLISPLNGSYDYGRFSIINDYDTKTDCDSGETFISYIGNKIADINVNSPDAGWDEENGRYNTYTL